MSPKIKVFLQDKNSFLFNHKTYVFSEWMGFVSPEKLKLNDLFLITTQVWSITKLRLFHNKNHVSERLSGRKALCGAGMRTCCMEQFLWPSNLAVDGLTVELAESLVSLIQALKDRPVLYMVCQGFHHTLKM